MGHPAAGLMSGLKPGPISETLRLFLAAEAVDES